MATDAARRLAEKMQAAHCRDAQRIRFAMKKLIKAIREAGRTPVQRNTFYEPIRVLENAPAARETEPPAGKSKVLEDNLATA